MCVEVMTTGIRALDSFSKHKKGIKPFTICEYGEIGIRMALKMPRRNPYRFKSDYSHQKKHNGQGLGV